MSRAGIVERTQKVLFFMVTDSVQCKAGHFVDAFLCDVVEKKIVDLDDYHGVQWLWRVTVVVRKGESTKKSTKRCSEEAGKEARKEEWKCASKAACLNV
jgi:hypothetical protein